MILTLQPTDRMESVSGTPARVWAGQTEDGTPVLVWIASIQPQTAEPERLAAFDRALKALPYRRDLVSFDLRMAT